jgi:hypothetical protein
MAMHDYTREHLKNIRSAYGDMASDFKPNAFLTLATNSTIDAAEVTRLIGRFCAMLDRLLLGHKWFKLPAEQRTDGMFLIEHADTNIHAHGILRMPKSDDPGLDLMIDRKWRCLIKEGTTDYSAITDLSGLVRYCTKEMILPSFNPDHVILTRQFMAS